MRLVVVAIVDLWPHLAALLAAQGMPLVELQVQLEARLEVPWGANVRN